MTLRTFGLWKSSRTHDVNRKETKPVNLHIFRNIGGMFDVFRFIIHEIKNSYRLLLTAK